MDEEPAAAGAPGFECAVLRKVRTPRWSLMEMETAPDDRWFRLFQEVFSTTISPLFWTWKYGEGRGRAVIAHGGGQLVAHYGGTTRRVMLRGTPCLALQVCDVMVDRRERAVLTRHGAFFEVGSAWLECNFGYRRDHALAFGFPNSRAMRVGERVGLYGEVGRLAEVSWDPLPERVGIHSTTRLLPPTGDHRALFDQLWREMSRDLVDRIAVIRDAEYLSYRYQTHPEFAYDFVAVVNRFTGHPRSLLVLKREADQCRLMDFVGPLQELPRAVAHARRMIGRWGVSRLVGWIMTRDAPLFVRAGACVQPTDICVPTNVWSEGPELSELRDRWWLMMGDTEFM